MEKRNLIRSISLIVAIILILILFAGMTGVFVNKNELPTASISVSSTTGTVSSAIEFTGSGDDTDGIIASYKWDFGDGETSNEKNPSHKYQKSGTYSVTLTIYDNDGAIETSNIVIIIKDDQSGKDDDIVDDDEEKDTDGDGLYDSLELKIGTDPTLKNTDGDRYTDKEEYENSMPQSNVIGEGRDPLFPAYPEFAVTIDNTYSIYLAQTIESTTGIINTDSQTYQTREISQKTTEWSNKLTVETGIKLIPYGSIKDEFSYKDTTTNTFITDNIHQFTSSYEWRETESINLPESYISFTLKVKNIGTDIIKSEIDQINLNVYIGTDSKPIIWNMGHDLLGAKVGTLKPGDVREFDIKIYDWLTTDILKRLDTGEALRTEVQPVYLDYEEDLLLQNVKDNLLQIDIDDGNELKTSYKKENDILLTDFLQKYANAEINVDGTIKSIKGINIDEKNFWDIIFPNKNDVNNDVSKIKLKKGEHVVLFYHHDKDEDGLDSRLENAKGLDPNKKDTDNDGLDDSNEFIGITDPLAADSDDDGLSDGNELYQYDTDPLNPDSDYDRILDGDDTNPKVGTFFPTDDAYISQKDPTDNYGTMEEMLIRNNDGGFLDSNDYQIDGLIKFDLSFIPDDALIVTATLYLYYDYWKDTNPSDRWLKLYRITDHDWWEENVTWEIQPESYSTTAQKKVPKTTFQWVPWDVENDVKSFIKGTNSNYGWRIRDGVKWDDYKIPITGFATKESDYDYRIPYLEIEIE